VYILDIQFMVKPKGGRGKRVEYESQMIRIPDPIRGKVLQLKQDFYDGKLDLSDDELPKDKS
jgi:hypothetical protein